MLDAADVLVDRHPVPRARVHHRLGVVRAGIAREIPGRIHEGVHGVGLALRRSAARGAGRLVERGHFRERIAGAVRHQVLGQAHGQVLFLFGHVAALRAVHDRNRAAPVALARNAPVAQPPLDMLLAEALRLKIRGDRVDRRLEIQAVVLAGIDERAVLGVLGFPGAGDRVAERMAHHRRNRQAVLSGEGIVALVVCRHCHHRTLAIAHQHVVRDPHRKLRAGERMGDEDARRHALLLDLRKLGFHHRAALAFLDEGREFGVGLRRMQRDRMLGGDCAEGGAHQRIGTRGENPERTRLAGQLVGEGETNAFRAADPVLLHELHLLGPSGQAVQCREQLLRILGNTEEVHRDLALFHHRAGAPATAFDDLLVRQHRLVNRVPVDDAGLLVGDALPEHANEQPLVPLVVLGTAGGEFALPVERKAEALQLFLHVGDVVVGPLRGRHLVRHRGVLGRQPEGVPAHGLHHVHAAHPVVPGEHIADGIVPHMPHVELARGVGEHGQAVELLLRRIFDAAERAARIPEVLCVAFDVLRRIAVLHSEYPGCPASTGQSPASHSAEAANYKRRTPHACERTHSRKLAAPGPVQGGRRQR